MIVVKDLTKRYRGRTVVDRVSFTCEPGTVTGFLGPNGAGKSTTLRMLCGLTTPNGGTTAIGGVPYAALPNPGREVGVLLDASAWHRGRTGRETLLLAAAVLGAPRDRVDQLLRLVGLAEAAGRRVGGYSLGMRQRLGIAYALLGDPRVLVLDEPANGLDPEGIRWMRNFLKTLAAEGRTVLVSSHLLSEMQQLADDVVIIAAGKLVRQGPIDAVVESMTDASQVRVQTPHADKLATALADHGAVVRTEAGGALVVTGVDAPTVGAAALQAGVELHHLSTERPDLEQVFLELTAGKATIR